MFVKIFEIADFSHIHTSVGDRVRKFLDNIARSDDAMQNSTIKILRFQPTKITEIF